jgi:fumarate reductase subunit D
LYEHRSQPLLSPRLFRRRLLLHGAVAGAVIALALALGACGYHSSESLPWLDALLEASMILSGMGPIHAPATTAGKLFASAYAIFSGVVFLGLTAVVLAPVIHRVAHKLHLDEKG